MKIEIEEECMMCEGSGRNWRKDGDICPSCKGVGTRLTELGEQVIAALARYYKLELRETIKVRNARTVPNPLLGEES